MRLLARIKKFVKSKKPKVSVVLTSFNHAPYLDQAIKSVLDQTYPDWELLIWDDCSSDDSWSVIQRYSDQRIRAFRNEQTRRYIYAINRSIMAEAKGQYIAIHHSDDAWMPEKLAKQVAFLDENPSIAGVFTHVQLIDEFNRHLANEHFNLGEQTKAQWLKFLFLNANKLCHPSALVRKKSYVKAGGYKLTHARTDDAEMWTRLLLTSPVHVIPEKLTLHRVFSDGRNVSAKWTERLPSNQLQFEWFEQKKNYLNLSFAELLGIFPEAVKWQSAQGESNNQFVLAMIAIHLGSCSGTQLFGLDLLYQLLNDPKSAQQIEQAHQFSYLDFINLSCQYTLFTSTENA